MADFMLRFLISNLFLSAILLFLFLLKHVLKGTLTGRMQYRLWYVMAGLLAVPFLPFPVAGPWQLFLWMYRLKNMASSHGEMLAGRAQTPGAVSVMGPIQDFALSAGRETPETIVLLLAGIWLMGILVMLFLFGRARISFHNIKQSALPLQNEEVRRLYENCLKELKITADIPIYSTAFLKSPVIAGIFRPCIYLPIHVISAYPAPRLRYMLLHELQHFRHKDPLAGSLMDLAAVLYWFNPLVWYALREMRGDREIACDAAVLALLEESDYRDYGYTLLALAKKHSPGPFPFPVGISGSMRQMQRRICHISAYKRPSAWKRAKGRLSFCVITAFLLGLTPLLSTCPADQDIYPWDTSSETISIVDLSPYFQGYRGSFVLYDAKADTWYIYNMEQAVSRVSPDSTYKIYDALFALEEGVITPQDSFMAWDGTDYPFASWKSGQDLSSAMQFSVNWYFQEIDSRLGKPTIKRYLREIGYGNEDIRADISSYWMQSSLQISPIEQVELLTALYQNRFSFAPEHIDTVKKSIRLFSSEEGNLYGKTGTGSIEGRDCSGWFIGFTETDGNPCFFAANIQDDTDASGSKAAEITLSILSHQNNFVSSPISPGFT